MPRLVLHRMEAVPPDRVARLGEELLRRMDAGGDPEPVLVVAKLCGQAVLLGRHQRASSALALEQVTAARLPVARRLGGGRALLAGEGTIAVLLALPSAGALLSERIGAEKVLNRHCRGLLRALTFLAGQPVAYFGRDVLSATGPAGSRQVATVSQEGLPGGAVLVEAFVSVGRSLALPAQLGGYPAHGDPRAAGPAHGTLAQASGRTPGDDELVEAIAAGFAASHSCEVAHADLQLLPVGGPPLPPPLEDESGLEESGVADIAIGFAEALVRHDGTRLTEARLRGDFLTPAFVLRELEASLVAAELTFAAIGSRVNAAFARPHAMSSGLTGLRVLADAVLAAAGRLGAKGA